MTESEGIETWKQFKIGDSALNVGLLAYPAFAFSVLRHLINRHCHCCGEGLQSEPRISSVASRRSVTSRSMLSMLGRRVRCSDVEAMFGCADHRFVGWRGFKDEESLCPGLGRVAGREGDSVAAATSRCKERFATWLSSGRATERLVL